MAKMDSLDKIRGPHKKFQHHQTYRLAYIRLESQFPVVTFFRGFSLFLCKPISRKRCILVNEMYEWPPTNFWRRIQPWHSWPQKRSFHPQKGVKMVIFCTFCMGDPLGGFQGVSKWHHSIVHEKLVGVSHTFGCNVTSKGRKMAVFIWKWGNFFSE